MGKSAIKYNRLPAVAAAISGAAGTATPVAADSLCDFLQRVLDDGSEGIESDTRALALSLYVKATGRDDYDAAVRAARDAFISNPSRWRGQPTQAAIEHFDAITADFEALAGQPAHVYAAAVATALSYGNVWEFEREWMFPAALEWAKNNAPEIYREAIADALS